MSEGKTLKEIALDLLEKYRMSETGQIWELSGSISEDTAKLEYECNYIREQIEGMAEPKWTPVSEGLPKKGGWYFVTWEDQFKTARGVTVSEFIEPKGLTDIGHFEGFVLREITAWMPLPEPYKEVMPNE